MKKAILIPFILLLLTSFSVRAQEKDTKDQLAIKQTMVSLFDAVSSLNMKAIKQNCTGNFLLLEDGQVWNIDTLENKLLAMGSKFTRVNKLDFITVSVNGQNAWVAYHNTGQFSAADGKSFNINWLESAVLIKQDNHWVVSMLHSTMLKAASKN